MYKYIKIIIMLLMLISCISVNAQSYTREGNTYIPSTGERSKVEPVKTKFTWRDSKGKEYPIYMSNAGSCFVIKISSKTGKEYRNYLDPKISQQICKELGVEYKGKRK